MICEECGEEHAIFIPGKRYRIDAEDCCLKIYGLVGTFVKWKILEESGNLYHIAAIFEEGFELLESWASTGWEIEELDV
jgi:hypothetical protein